MISKVLFTAFAVALTVSCCAISLPDSFVHQDGAADAAEKAAAMVRKNGCDPNICFAIDGSGSMTDYEFNLQKDFAKLVATVISADPDGAYSAVQYGAGLRRITLHATTDIEKFQDRMEASEHMKASRTFIAPGIGNCIRQLDRWRNRDEPKKIVLLGDGRSNFDASSGPLDPAYIVNQWQEDKEEKKIVAVAVNAKDEAPWTKIVGEGNVYMVHEWLDVLRVMEMLVRDVCGWDELKF